MQLAFPSAPVVSLQVCALPPVPSVKSTEREGTALLSLSVSAAESFAADP